VKRPTVARLYPILASRLSVPCPSRRSSALTKQVRLYDELLNFLCPLVAACTGVDKGGCRGPSPPQWPGKNFLFVKIEGLSSLPPGKSGRACYDNPTGRGYFYQMPNMYTCIAYLMEIRKFCSKNLVHKGVNFEAQNALKLTYEHL